MHGLNVGDEIQAAIWHGLNRAGRDWKALDRTLHRIGQRLFRAEPFSPAWYPEYREFLRWEFRRELSTALDRAVDLEEYEWASAIQRYCAMLDSEPAD